MSQRLGMADGRCFTISMSNQLLTEEIAKKAGINILDNDKMRKFLQKRESVVEPWIPDQPCGIRNYAD